LRGVARALRCAKLRVLREHLVLPLGGAHLLRLVEGRAAARLLRGQGGETAPQRHSLRCKPVQHSAAWWAADAGQVPNHALVNVQVRPRSAVLAVKLVLHRAAPKLAPQQLDKVQEDLLVPRRHVAEGVGQDGALG